MLWQIDELWQFSPVPDRHYANILIVGFLQMRSRTQGLLIAQMLIERSLLAERTLLVAKIEKPDENINPEGWFGCR
jgi:hypothetical protein